jgi:hypothetical protein
MWSLVSRCHRALQGKEGEGKEEVGHPAGSDLGIRHKVSHASAVSRSVSGDVETMNRVSIRLSGSTGRRLQ